MQKKYWLRGGVIGLIFSVIAVGIFLLEQTTQIGGTYISNDFVRVFIMPFTHTPIKWISLILPSIDNIGLAFIFGWLSIIIIPPTFYFIIGAILGWIYGKIKNRNKDKLV